jgi:hypothetical protein
MTNSCPVVGDAGGLMQVDGFVSNTLRYFVVAFALSHVASSSLAIAPYCVGVGVGCCRGVWHSFIRRSSASARGDYRL